MESKEITTEQPVAQPTQAQNKVPEFLNQQQALQVLVDAARVAQAKGVFSLDDAELVNKAIRAFVPQGPVPTNG